MQDQMTARLETLRKEFEIGKTRLLQLEREEAALRETLLRISGAIQVLEELLSQSSGTKEQEAAALRLMPK